MDGAWWGHQRVPWEGVKCPPSVRRVCPYKWSLYLISFDKSISPTEITPIPPNAHATVLSRYRIRLSWSVPIVSI